MIVAGSFSLILFICRCLKKEQVSVVFVFKVKVKEEVPAQGLGQRAQHGRNLRGKASSMDLKLQAYRELFGFTAQSKNGKSITGFAGTCCLKRGASL